MTGLERSTVSPSSSTMTRSTPWVDGCDGPRLRIMVSSSGDLHIDVGRVESNSLGQAQGRSGLQVELPGAAALPGHHLLTALVGLGLEDLVSSGPPGGTRPRMRSSRLTRRVC